MEEVWIKTDENEYQAMYTDNNGIDWNVIKIINDYKKMLQIYKLANNQTELVSNQGQAMDGFSELANYRAIIRDFYETVNNSTSE